MKSSDYNTTDWQKYRKLMMTGILAALTALAGDMILGWGVCDESMSGFAYYFSRYMTVSEERIAIAAFLGMVGIPIECLCYYGIHGLIRNERYAGMYRIGLTGILIFGALVHVLCCIMVSYGKMCFMSDPVAAQNRIFRFGLYYLIPPCLIFFAFFITAAVIRGMTANSAKPRDLTNIFMLIIRPLNLRKTGERLQVSLMTASA